MGIGAAIGGVASAASAAAAAATTSTAMTVASLTGTAISAVGAYASAQRQAAVDKQNSAIAGQNALVAGVKGQQAQYNQALRSGAEVGQQVAAFAGGGVNTQSAGAQSVISGTRTAGVTDQSMLKFNSNADVTNLNSQAQMDKENASATSLGGDISAFGTLLSGANSLGNQSRMWQKFGVTSND